MYGFVERREKLIIGKRHCTEMFCKIYLNSEGKCGK
jgi:hypothetical protein